MGDLFSFSMYEVVQNQRQIKNFQGAIMISNFGNFEPYSIIKDKHKLIIHGIFKDILDVACEMLNITLKIRKPLPENEGIWGKM